MSKDISFVYLYDFYKDMLTEKQSGAIDLYYNEDLSLAEISEQLGITRQGVRDNIKRAEQLMLNLESKIGAAQRHRTTCNSLKSAVDELCRLADTANEKGNSEEAESCREIIEQIEGVINGI